MKKADCWIGANPTAKSSSSVRIRLVCDAALQQARAEARRERLRKQVTSTISKDYIASEYG